jgi:RNA-binding protein YlmH
MVKLMTEKQKRFDELAQRANERGYTVYSDFLGISEISEFCAMRFPVPATLWGGYEDAERTVAAFLPDYADKEDSPLSVIRIKTPPGGRQLTHRDYLGSLTGLGLEREMIGDILTTENGADVIILDDIQDFLLLNYSKAGRTSLQLAALPLSELHIPEQRTVMIKDTVASLRLDNVVSAAFSLSRGKAAEAIRSGLVFVNSIQCEKTDMQVEEGCKLVLRGKGKAYLREVGGRTRKDRIFVAIEKFV